MEPGRRGVRRQRVAGEARRQSAVVRGSAPSQARWFAGARRHGPAELGEIFSSPSGPMTSRSRWRCDRVGASPARRCRSAAARLPGAATGLSDAATFPRRRGTWRGLRRQRSRTTRRCPRQWRSGRGMTGFPDRAQSSPREGDPVMARSRGAPSWARWSAGARRHGPAELGEILSSPSGPMTSRSRWRCDQAAPHWRGAAEVRRRGCLGRQRPFDATASPRRRGTRRGRPRQGSRVRARARA
jgi:hypothetical protein